MYLFYFFSVAFQNINENQHTKKLPRTKLYEKSNRQQTDQYCPILFVYDSTSDVRIYVVPRWSDFSQLFD